MSLIDIAREFSPRYERHGAGAIVIDVAGFERLLGPPPAIARELEREASARGARVHIALAVTRTAALVTAYARPGITVIERGHEKTVLASIPISVLENFHDDQRRARGERRELPLESSANSAISVLKRWGIRTLGELAALPPADLAARLGQSGLVWQSLARGEDLRPLVPELPEERFDEVLDLEWPIEGREPLSFVLTRLLEPLSARLELRDRGAAALFLELGLVTDGVHVRRLELPAPIRDVRTLRTLALLDLESHPPSAAIDRVQVVIEPTPGRVLQHALFARAHPTPEQLSTLLARLGALMGQDRIGSPGTVDSYRPGAFEMKPFAMDQEEGRRARGARRDSSLKDSASAAISALNVVSALRRCRRPVPARVALDADGRPMRVTTDRAGFAGGLVQSCTGPWRSSGAWWAGGTGRAGRSDKGTPLRRPVLDTREGYGPSVSGVGVRPHAIKKWDREEWDTALSDGAAYRIFRDCDTNAWFIDAIVD